MSKADNKELEEAIKRALKEKNRGTATIGVEVLETILNELERLQEENNKLEKANKIYINSIQSITPVLLKDYIEKDKIREKIEFDTAKPQYIETIWGVGYRFKV